MENFYGDFISDLTAGLVGGLGVVPGANYGAECALFEAVHGSAPDIAGRGIANPTAVILSGVELLRHIGEVEAAERISKAVHRVLGDSACRTPDLGGKSTTSEFTGRFSRPWGEPLHILSSIAPGSWTGSRSGAPANSGREEGLTG
jgi:isocitrate dehydrogenase (NAD+)